MSTTRPPTASAPQPRAGGAALLRRLRTGAASDGGFTLIEVVISAALLILIIVATLQGFDSAGRFTSNQQRRSEATTIAQQDEDKLRAMPVNQLSNFSRTYSTTINSTTYTITSTGEFVNSGNGGSSCTSSGQADEVLTTSTVSWKNLNNGSTQSITTKAELPTPPGGALIVDVINAQGSGVANMNVTATGPAPANTSVTGTTASDGCAIFAGLQGGTYNVSVSQPGYVDKDGNTTPPVNQQATDVVEGTSVVKTFQYDIGGTIKGTFTAFSYAGVSGPAPVDDMVMFNNNMTYPGFRWAPNANGTLGAATSPITSPSTIFPFPSQYTVYAGECAANAPTANGQATDPSVTVTPGGQGSFTEPLPELYVTVKNAANKAITGATVKITDLGCGGTPPAAGGTPNIVRTFITNASGQLANPGLPYGSYTVCAFSAGKYTQQTPVAVSNNTSTGTKLTLVPATNGAACP